MGASVALATGAGCNLRPAAQRKILPYTTQPDEVTPGVPTYYATSAPLAGYGQGVLVRSNEGRPTKIEGNPDAPSSLGGAGLHALASVLDLYDPDRSRGVTHRGSPASYELAVAAIRAKLYAGAAVKTDVRLRILTETVTSPTLTAQIGSLLATFPNARWVQYDAVSRESTAPVSRRRSARRSTSPTTSSRPTWSFRWTPTSCVPGRGTSGTAATSPTAARSAPTARTGPRSTPAASRTSRSRRA